MADYTVASDYTVEDVRGLTVPKLKAELARLNQPLAGLKLKAQFADALTVSSLSELAPKEIQAKGGPGTA